MKTRSRPARRSLFHDEGGLSASEYVIIMLLICVVCFLAWRIFGSQGRERTGGAHQVVSGLATTSSADGEGGAAHGSQQTTTPEAAPTAPGATPHGGRGDIQRGQRLGIPGQEAEYGEDPEIRASRNRTRNFRWVVIGVMTAGILAFLLGRSKRG